jgi:hypothetical protein
MDPKKILKDLISHDEKAMIGKMDFWKENRTMLVLRLSSGSLPFCWSITLLSATPKIERGDRRVRMPLQR